MGRGTPGMDLAKEIEKMQRELVTLAETKDNPLADPEIYERSCLIDKMIVELMRNMKQQD